MKSLEAFEERVTLCSPVYSFGRKREKGGRKKGPAVKYCPLLMGVLVF